MWQASLIPRSLVGRGLGMRLAASLNKQQHTVASYFAMAPNHAYSNSKRGLLARVATQAWAALHHSCYFIHHEKHLWSMTEQPTAIASMLQSVQNKLSSILVSFMPMLHLTVALHFLFVAKLK